MFDSDITKLFCIYFGESVYTDLHSNDTHGLWKGFWKNNRAITPSVAQQISKLN